MFGARSNNKDIYIYISRHPQRREATRFWHSVLGHRLAPGVAANVVDIQDSKWQGLR